MFSSFLLSLREGIEAALVIGIMLGALRQLRRQECAPVIWGGLASAIGASLVAAVLLNLLGWTLDGAAEEIFEGVMLLGAAGLLTWMILWMRRQSQHLRGELEDGVRQAVCAPGHRALFMLTFIAVGREGVELALFLTAASVETTAAQTFAGTLAGLTAAALLGWSLFATTRRLNLRRFFQLTSALLILFAAGMVASGVHEFNEVGWIPGLIDPVWNTESALGEKSAAGALLKGLFGYTSHPSLTALIAYLAYLGVIGYFFLPARPPTAPVKTGRSKPTPRWRDLPASR